MASDDERLRFEATARTPVFYFADDVVVVVTPEGDAARVDMRGVSRIGRSDQGVDAARIRAFQRAFSCVNGVGVFIALDRVVAVS